MAIVVKAINHGRVFYQDADGDAGNSEQPLLIHVDNRGMLIVEQEGGSITLNWTSLRAFTKALLAIANEVNGA